MRHFLRGDPMLGVASPAPVARLASRMPVPTPPCRLIPPPRGARLLATALLRAHPAAVPLAAVAHRTDRYQPATANTCKEPVVWPHRQPSGCRGAGRRSRLRRYSGAGTRWQRRASEGGPGGVTAKSVTLLGLRRLSAAARSCSPTTPPLSRAGGPATSTGSPPAGPPAPRPRRDDVEARRLSLRGSPPVAWKRAS
jgi:hypothetical protein